MTRWRLTLDVDVPPGRITWLLKALEDAAANAGVELIPPITTERKTADVVELNDRRRVPHGRGHRT